MSSLVLFLAIWTGAFSMTPQQAYNYAKQVISPILVKYTNNQGELPALRNRLVNLAQKIARGEIDYRALPIYYPKGRDFLAKIDYDLKLDKPLLLLFVPAVADWRAQLKAQGRLKNFEDGVAVVFAHEMMHLEQEGREALRERAGVYAPYIAGRNEARATCATILELFRPMANQGRIPFPEMIHNSQELRKVGDDCNHPAWIEAFVRNETRIGR